jgi:hypothetical protein
MDDEGDKKKKNRLKSARLIRKTHELRRSFLFEVLHEAICLRGLTTSVDTFEGDKGSEGDSGNFLSGLREEK